MKTISNEVASAAAVPFTPDKPVEGQKLSLSSPWYEYREKVATLFSYDDEVAVSDVAEDANGVPSFSVYAKTFEKTAALKLLLPETVPFGNVVLHVDVKCNGDYIPEAFEVLSKGNGAIHDVVHVEGTGLAPDRYYVRFEPEVVQYYADDLSSYSGYKSALVADIAKDIFESLDPSVSLCTMKIGEN